MYLKKKQKQNKNQFMLIQKKPTNTVDKIIKEMKKQKYKT